MTTPTFGFSFVVLGKGELRIEAEDTHDNRFIENMSIVDGGPGGIDQARVIRYSAP